MYYQNYNPFYNMRNRSYYYSGNINTQNQTPIIEQQPEKKDTASSNDDTIPFQDFCPNNNLNTTSQSSKNRLFSFSRDKINILGFDLEIDDLIILALIILLVRDFSENYALIIILGLILLNVNLSDIINFF